MASLSPAGTNATIGPQLDPLIFTAIYSIPSQGMDLTHPSVTWVANGPDGWEPRPRLPPRSLWVCMPSPPCFFAAEQMSLQLFHFLVCSDIWWYPTVHRPQVGTVYPPPPPNLSLHDNVPHRESVPPLTIIHFAEDGFGPAVPQDNEQLGVADGVRGMDSSPVEPTSPPPRKPQDEGKK